MILCSQNLVTNAAGGLNPDFMVGDICIINDVRSRFEDSNFLSSPLTTCKYTVQMISGLTSNTGKIQHINFPGLAGVHPLRGPNAEEFGPRFPPMSDAYDLELRRSAHVAYKKLALSIPTRRLHEGVYAFVSGPTYVVPYTSNDWSLSY